MFFFLFLFLCFFVFFLILFKLQLILLAAVCRVSYCFLQFVVLLYIYVFLETFVHTVTQFSMLATPPPPSFLDKSSLSMSLIFFTFCPFVWVPPESILKTILSILQGWCFGGYSFNEISATVVGFEKLPRSSEVLFPNFFSFISFCLMGSAFSILKFL